MIQLVFIFFIVPRKIQASIVTYAQGSEDRFSYYYDSNFNCQASATPSYTFTTTYGTNIQFANKPQIIISSTYYAIGYANNPNNNYTFTVVNIGLTGTQESSLDFTATITCPSPSRVWTFYFNWIAIDDQRIEVITIANQNMENVPSQVYTYSHSNPNARYGYVSLVNFGWIGPIIIKVDIVTITKDTVQVQYTTSNTNCIGLGYQIILSTSDTLSTSILREGNLTTVYDSNRDINPYLTVSQTYDLTLNKQAGRILIAPILGFDHSSTEDVRIKVNFTETSTTIALKWYCWYSGWIYLFHKEVWLTLPITQIFRPMMHFRTRVSRKDNPFAQFNDKMSLKIVETNQAFKSVSDSADLIFDVDQFSQLNLEIYFQIGYWQKIQGQVLACSNCDKPFITMNLLGYKQINEVTHFLTLNKDNAYQVIHVEVSQTGFIITQTVINQISQTFTVLSLNILNK